MLLIKRILPQGALSIVLLMAPIVAHAEIEFKLPRSTDSVEFLLGFGHGYDDTAFLGEKSLSEPSIAIAILTENFYLDVHQVSYKLRPTKDLALKVFGNSDSLPVEEYIPSEFNIKSGDSFDVGISIEKQFDSLRIGLLSAVDVTGIHDGYKLELSTGFDSITDNIRAGVTIGARYEDQKRSNYYYGVALEEASSSLAAYDVQGEWTAFSEAMYFHEVSHGIAFVASTSISSLGESAKKSSRTKNDTDIADFETFVAIVWQFPVL